MSIFAALHSVASRVTGVTRAIIGVPNYDAYVAHMRAHHPDAMPLDRETFARERMDARYSRPGSRCC